MVKRIMEVNRVEQLEYDKAFRELNSAVRDSCHIKVYQLKLVLVKLGTYRARCFMFFIKVSQIVLY